MKKVLIAYPNMAIGGSTTSLLGLLSVMDEKIYDVDLLLYQNEGTLLNEIPKYVNVLQPARKSCSRMADRFFRFSHPSYILKRLYGKYKAKTGNYKLLESQLMAYDEAKYSRRVKKHYDIAISFLEGWPSVYIAKYITADKKIAWVHVDYENAGLNPKYDSEIYSKFDDIVTVSEICKKNMIKSFPQLADKIMWIGNISNVLSIKKKAREDVGFEVEESTINFMSACRISMRHKGLDRMLWFLRDNKKCGGPQIKWYIAGNGHDKKEFCDLILKYGLKNDVILLGEQENPFPYLAKMDAFVLLSRYEGKPMAVTEALVLGIPVIVAEYASAKEQIENNVNGFILNNSDQTISSQMQKIVRENDFKDLRKKMQMNNFSFDKEKEQIYKLLREKK